MTAAAYVNRTGTVREGVDTLAAVATVEVAARLLKPGMVLVDPEFDTPAVEIDHRTRTVRGSGQVSFLVFDYDVRNWVSVALGANSMIKVMARI